jgi:hypothetical protein
MLAIQKCTHVQYCICIQYIIEAAICSHGTARGYAGAEQLAGSPEATPGRRLCRGISFLSSVIISWWGCCIAEKRFRNVENDACCFAAFFLNMRKNISHTEI